MRETMKTTVLFYTDRSQQEPATITLADHPDKYIEDLLSVEWQTCKACYRFGSKVVIVRPGRAYKD